MQELVQVYKIEEPLIPTRDHHAPPSKKTSLDKSYLGKLLVPPTDELTWKKCDSSDQNWNVFELLRVRKALIIYKDQDFG